MRTALIALLILIILVGYGHYQQHPDDRAKLVAQATTWLHGVIPAILSNKVRPPLGIRKREVNSFIAGVVTAFLTFPGIVVSMSRLLRRG